MRSAAEMEAALIELLDAIASDGRIDTASREAARISESGDPLYTVRWRGEGFRPFHELMPLAQRTGKVKRLQRLQGVAINGETQWTLDPALLERFGFPGDANSKDMAELAGFPDYPYAHDIDGRRIPMLSTRHPRPQRQHRPHAHSGMHGTFVKAPLPPYARGLNTPAPTPAPAAAPMTAPPVAFVGSALDDYVSPLRAELARGLRIFKHMGRKIRGLWTVADGRRWPQEFQPAGMTRKKK